MVAGGLWVGGVALLWAGLHGPASAPAPDTASHDHAPPPAAASTLSTPQPTSGRSTAATDRSDVRDRTTGRVLPESAPVELSVPRIGVRSRLVELGLDAEGAMEVPRDPARAGWFARSAAPGALGPAVIAGHVTWNGAPAVFSRLGRLRHGDQVSVTREDGRTAVFTVDRVARFSKSRFPSEEVYGTIDHSGLRLITCGGTYDRVRHRYLDNVVVFASLTQVRGRRS